eukprot:scaffold539_cov187-Ochromonas_danica.AAC.1
MTDSPYEIFLRIMNRKISFPRHVVPTSRRFIASLCLARVDERLTDMENIKKHEFFSLPWDAVYERRIVPPFIPRLERAAEISTDQGRDVVKNSRRTLFSIKCKPFAFCSFNQQCATGHHLKTPISEYRERHGPSIANPNFADAWKWIWQYIEELDYGRDGRCLEIWIFGFPALDGIGRRSRLDTKNPISDTIPIPTSWDENLRRRVLGGRGK